MSKYKHKIIDGHTKIFWNRKFKEIKEWQEQQLERGEALINPIRTKQDLIDTWATLKEEGSTDITKDLKYNTKYETKYREARAFRESLQEAGEYASLKEMKKMSHQERIDKYGDAIRTYYQNLKGYGLSSKEARQIISQDWFGSP